MPNPSGPGEDEAFRLLVMADLTGRASRGVVETGRALAKRRTVAIDRDVFDDVIAAMAPSLRVAAGGDAVLVFRSLDDFRPEALVENVPALRELMTLRRRLANPATFDDALGDARRALGAGEPESARASAGRETREELAPETDGASVLEQLLAGSATRRAEPAGDDWDAAVRGMVAPEIARIRVPGAVQGQSAWVAAADAALAARLRAVLRHPAFRSLEATWRSIHRLVRRLETGAELKIALLDVSRDEVAADAGVSGGFETSGLHEILVERTVGTQGGKPWSLVVADFAFDAEPRDVATLLRLARIVRAGQANLVTGAAPGVVGCRSLGETPDPGDWNAASDGTGQTVWSALRRAPEAASVAVAWPRLLVRLPYGEATDQAEGFSFEELADGFGHERLLWGNGAFAVALAIARARATGEDVDPEIDDLPALVATRDGETELQPCAETWLATRGVERTLARGLLPIVSVRGRGAVRLGNVNSIADPPARLV